MFGKYGKTASKVLVLFLLAAIVATMFCGTVSAEEAFPTEPYDSYSYWAGPGGNRPTSSTAFYEYKSSIDTGKLGIGPLKNPQDVFVDNRGYVYIADTDNGRIVVLNSDGTLKTVLKDLKYNGETLNFKGVLGVFVYKNGNIYICDTNNARVIICDLSGKVSLVLKLPPADVIPDDFTYRPSKVVVDDDGITYVVSDGSYYGAIMYNLKGEFQGFYGSNSVEGTLLTALGKLWDLMFPNTTKKSAQEKQLPFQFSDISIDKNNFIYTATGATDTTKSSEGQLKKLSPGGTSILKNKTRKNVTSADTYDFTDGLSVKVAGAGGYGTRVSDMRSVDVDNEGYIYGLCNTSGHIFIYDQDCNQIGVFGGGVSFGTQKGTFISPYAIHYNRLNNDILVVDKNASNVTIYKQTEYGALIKKAQKLTSAGAYEESKPYWEQVLKIDKNCQLAYSGMAKVCYMEKDYKQAMEYAKKGFDQETYANAFSFVRNEYLSQNFIWLAAIVVLVVGAIVAFGIYKKKKNIVLIKNEEVKLMFSSITHPFETGNKIRYFNKGSVTLATLLLVLYYIATVTNDMYQGFMHSLFNKSTYNSIMTILSSVGLIALFSLCNWGMSTLFEGKGTLKQVYIVTCYSLIPQIFNLVFQTIFTNVFTPEENLILNAVSVVCMALTIIIFCIGMICVHEFGLFKLIFMVLISFLAMLVVIFVAFMVFILVNQMFSFIYTLYQELKYR